MARASSTNLSGLEETMNSHIAALAQALLLYLILGLACFELFLGTAYEVVHVPFTAAIAFFFQNFINLVSGLA